MYPFRCVLVSQQAYKDHEDYVSDMITHTHKFSHTICFYLQIVKNSLFSLSKKSYIWIWFIMVENICWTQTSIRTRTSIRIRTRIWIWTSIRLRASIRIRTSIRTQSISMIRIRIRTDIRTWTSIRIRTSNQELDKPLDQHQLRTSIRIRTSIRTQSRTSIRTRNWTSIIIRIRKCWKIGFVSLTGELFTTCTFN